MQVSSLSTNSPRKDFWDSGTQRERPCNSAIPWLPGVLSIPCFKLTILELHKTDSIGIFEIWRNSFMIYRIQNDLLLYRFSQPYMFYINSFLLVPLVQCATLLKIIHCSYSIARPLTPFLHALKTFTQIYVYTFFFLIKFPGRCYVHSVK